MNHYDASPLPVQKEIANYEPFTGWRDTVTAVNGLIPEEVLNASDPSVAALNKLYNSSRLVDPQVLTSEEAAAFAKVENLRDVIAEHVEAQGLESAGHPMIERTFTDVVHAALDARARQDRGEQGPA